MPNESTHGAGDLSRRVLARRRELGLTRAELAARSGMAVSYLAYLEKHPANISYDGLIRLADALGTTPYALLGCSAQPAHQGRAAVPQQGTGPVSAPKLAAGALSRPRTAGLRAAAADAR